MTTRPARRDVLRLSGGILLGGVLSACTGGSAPPSRSSAASGPSTPSTASAGPGSASTVPSRTRPALSDLARRVSGGVTRRGHAGYHPQDLLYNPRFARQPPPQAIARCRTADDVVACVRFAADGGAALRVRNGGHSYGGWSSGPGLVADLGPLRGVHVDTAHMTARVEAGALLIDVYTALAARGVSIGAGSCPTVGITGLTLGGGIGVLSRSYGLTCDQLTAVDAVTADGRLRTVDTHHDPDLFWALRGGGGSFAAVTTLTFAVRPAPEVATFFLQWPWSSAAEVLAAWQDWIVGRPRELWTTCKLLSDGGGALRVTVSGTWTGDGSTDAQLAGLLRSVPVPSASSRSQADYGQTMLGEAGCSGESAGACSAGALGPAKRLPFAATSSIVSHALPSQGIRAIVDAVEAGSAVAGAVESGASFDSLGGAIADIDGAGSAFPWRRALAVLQHTATWPSTDASTDPAPFDEVVHRQRAALRPWSGTSAYVNYADPTISDFASAYWSGNAPRLTDVKRAYDPHNVFAFPQSVPQ